jgi:hypothetical protein
MPHSTRGPAPPVLLDGLQGQGKAPARGRSAREERADAPDRLPRRAAAWSPTTRGRRGASSRFTSPLAGAQTPLLTARLPWRSPQRLRGSFRAETRPRSGSLRALARRLDRGRGRGRRTIGRGEGSRRQRWQLCSRAADNFTLGVWLPAPLSGSVLASARKFAETLVLELGHLAEVS